MGFPRRRALAVAILALLAGLMLGVPRPPGCRSVPRPPRPPTPEAPPAPAASAERGPAEAPLPAAHAPRAQNAPRAER